MGALWLLHLLGGMPLAASGWLLPRRIAGAGRTAAMALLLDMAPWVSGAGLLLLATGQPVFAGLVILALGAGFALVDRTMRQTLREPIVFSEMSELPQVFTHPHLYLPFAGPGLVIGGAAGAVALGLALLLLEPPIWTPQPEFALLAAALLLAAGWLIAREPLLGTAAGLLARLRPTGEPFADTARLGPFTMLLAHTVIARAERARRRAALCAPKIVRAAREQATPLILVQCESFFDARRISPSLPNDLLPGFDACCATAAMSGRLEVPGWGANTMRTEFAVLTGIPETELGYDRFNPYYALARTPIASQVWRLRQAGYRTICLHPFDRRFFRRDLAMPALGFERFLGGETLAGPQRPPYYSDPDLAREILRVIEREGPETFVFAITMGNHGPWMADGPPLDRDIPALFDPAEVPDGSGLLRYLAGLKRSDMMLQILIGELERRGRPAVVAFYGDHLPSLPRAFAHFGFAETSADYVIWNGDSAAKRRDIPAHRLGQAVIATAAFTERRLTERVAPLPA